MYNRENEMYKFIKTKCTSFVFLQCTSKSHRNHKNGV